MDRASQHWILAFNFWVVFIQLFVSFGYPKLQEHVGSKIINNDYNLEFISIDCGLPQENSNYTEPLTGINYISDDSFINSGVSKNIKDEFRSTYKQQHMWNVRSFPEGIRNCYKINIKSGSKYLIRVIFLYGNYDGLNILPKFDLHLGSNWWDTVNITDASGAQVLEIIHIPPLDNINICLADTSSGTPFVSTIELRLLEIASYVTQSGSLALSQRLDIGSNQSYRFNYDARDRFWYPYNPQGSTQLRVPIDAVSIGQNGYNMPKAVMSTAATPLNASAPLNFRWQTKSPNDKFYLYMHFTELKASNETRSFNITINGNFWESVELSYLGVITTAYSRSPSSSSGEMLDISLERAQKSTLPPIINAMEIYIVKDFQQLDTDQGDVDAITSIKSTYEVRKNWRGDPCGPVEYVWIGLNCTSGEKNPPRITTLNLSSSGLTGDIDPSIFKLTMLEKLDLSNNNLSGQVPYFLSKLQSLRILNLDNNNLTGSLPSQLLEKSKEGSLVLSVSQNPYLCESPACNNNNSSNNKKRNIIVPLVASLGVFLILLVAVAALFLTLKRRNSKDVKEEAYVHDTSLQAKRRQYSYSDIINMTNNFNRVLGQGGFGAVYLGYIDDSWVAVKMLSPSSVQGYQQFQAEVKLLMRVHHRNLTTLIGYCNEETNKGLIYEYMANGNLQEHLSGKDSNSKLLTWKDRLHIAMDAAQGLEYLHNGCKPSIIHRDVKSTNFLLNEQFQAKLSDFGLSKFILIEGATHVSTVIAGTPGYLDPEYSTSNRITEKSDVYSFGVVLLEIITGRAVFARNEEKTHISQWVWSMAGNGDIGNIVDSRLQGDFDGNSAWKAVEVALACVALSSNRRPTMSEVVSELKECLATELSQTKYSGFNTGDLAEVRMNVSTEFTPLAR